MPLEHFCFVCRQGKQATCCFEPFCDGGLPEALAISSMCRPVFAMTPASKHIGFVKTAKRIVSPIVGRPRTPHARGSGIFGVQI